MKNQRASDNRGNVVRVKLARHSLNILARVIGIKVFQRGQSYPDRRHQVHCLKTGARVGLPCRLPEKKVPPAAWDYGF